MIEWSSRSGHPTVSSAAHACADAGYDLTRSKYSFISANWPFSAATSAAPAEISMADPISVSLSNPYGAGVGAYNPPFGGQISKSEIKNVRLFR
jgi:hypothetical protein